MDYEKNIIDLVRNEKKNYEDTSREIRADIKRARKNYSCRFDVATTSAGREKTFIPLTRWEVDTVVPKIFVNDKAVTVLPRNEASYRAAFIADKTLKYQIRETSFPMYFRNSMYDLGIDGTTVWVLGWNFEKETIYAEEEKKSITRKLKDRLSSQKNSPVPPQTNVLTDKIYYKQIDLLNVFIDPTADSIQDAPSIIYRNVTTLNAIKNNTQYKNTENVKGYTTEIFDSYDSRSTNKYNIGTESPRYEQPMVGVYERWGDFPKAWMTKKESDENKMVCGVITVADLDSGKPVLLRIDTNPFEHNLKPFVECWYQKKIGRWYGIGAAEKLIPLQSYYNKAVNRRIENEDVLHAGVFKIKRGSGLSAKNIVSTPGGVIEVENMADIEQLQIRDISQLSDGTITMIQNFVERINGANEIATGSAADRSATTSLIKDRNSDTRFAAVRGYVNDFLIRFFNQWLALDRQFLDKNFVLRVTGEDTELAEIDKMLGLSEYQRQNAPNIRFIDVDPKTIRGEFDLEADIDASTPMNKAENAQRILQAIQIGKSIQLPRDYDKLFDAYLDAIGLQGSKYKTRVGQNPMSGQGKQPGAAQSPTEAPNGLSQFMSANGTQPQPGVELPPSMSSQIMQ